MSLEESDFTTEFEDGTDVPVRRVGDHYIVAYDFLSAEEFLEYINALLDREGDDTEYGEDDIRWENVIEIVFDEDFSRIVFDRNQDPDAVPVTILECW